MEKKRGKQRRGTKTKKHILEVALELFSKKGFDAVTVEEIVNKSNTSKGSFYTHFQSKHGIFLEKFKEIDDFYLEFSQTLSNELSSKDKILIFVEAQMKYIQEELGKEIMRVIYSNALIPNPENYFLNQNRHLTTILNHYVEEGRKNNEISKKLSTEEIITVLTRCMRGSIYDWCMTDEDVELYKVSRNIFTVVLEGLKYRES